MQISGSSVYIHIPFCRKKCPYCHFYSTFPKDDLVNSYIKALILEIRAYLSSGSKIVSIYFGGGTPSILRADQISEILKNIPNISNLTEITLEANPDDVSKDRIKEFMNAGINRISMGVQSFVDDELIALERTHSSKKALEAIASIYLSGIDNISIDLMYDLPYQTLQSFESTLNITTKTPVKHISLYNLTFEEKTRFHTDIKKYIPLLPSNEASFNMLQLANDHLTENNFKRYEISAFAKEGKHSIHNSGYWTGREFFGFGPAAFSYVNQKRYKNIPNVNQYIDLINSGKSAVSFEEKLPLYKRQSELLAVNLRLVAGVNMTLFQKKNGPLSKDTEKILDDLILEGLLLKKNDNLSLTKKGLLFYDHVAETII